MESRQNGKATAPGKPKKIQIIMTTNNHYYEITCFSCGRKTSDDCNTICPSCNGPLDIKYDYDHLKEQLNYYILRNTPPKVIKYLDFYPIQERHGLSSLNEGGTPLQPAKNLGKKYGLENLYIKNEGLNPTGAFKDRGSFVEINKAKELGFKTVCVASTGNMAASVAAYASQTGLNCFVVVPESTPKGKLAQALSYGANVIQVRGTYSDAYNLTVQLSKENKYYLAGDFAYRGEGQKSLAYEVCEQLWFGDIDFVIVPVGMGTNLSYIYKGFKEYFEFGLIKKIPRMVAVQSYGASPIVTAYDSGKKLVPVTKPDTICSAISVGNPIDAPKVFSALKLSKGLAIAVNDDETLSAQQDLAKLESLYVEASSATCIAALRKLIGKKIIKADHTIVCVATGAGLKDPSTTLKILAEPPTIEPILSEAVRIIKSGVLSLRAGSVGEKERIIFSKVPSDDILKKIIKKEFKLEIPIDTLKTVKKVADKFISAKGKKIAKADLQSIIETVLQDEKRPKSLEVLDYHIETFKKEKSSAFVKIRLEGKIFQDESTGVGPVDAAINAIVKVIKKVNDFDFKLTDFQVEIPTTGSDATVEVMMSLRDDKGNQVFEKGTSPDIIVASIEAYEKGYNELVYKRLKNGG